MHTKPLKILIVDDHQLFAEGLALIFSKLDRELDIESVSNPRTIINQLTPSSDYDLIIVDLYMPTLNGFAFLKSLSSRKIKIPTMVISSSEEISDIELAFKYGAKGFIPKNAPTHEMLNGVSQVLRGRRYLPDHLSVDIVLPDSESEVDAGDGSGNTKFVSSRQLEVLTLIQNGHSNSEIAMVLGVSESTVKGHVAALFKVLKVKNRTACVRAASELKLI